MTRLTLIVIALCAPVLTGCQQPNSVPHNERGDQALLSENWARAASEYEKALAARPDQPKARHGLARAYIGLGRPLEAAEQAKIAYAQRPEEPEYADTVAEALLKADRKDELFRFLRQNASERGRVDDWVRLGTFARAAGDADSAMTALITAARVDRGRTAAPQLGLYELYASLGQRDKAMQRLRNAYYAEPTNSRVRTALAAEGIQPEASFGQIPPERWDGVVR